MAGWLPKARRRGRCQPTSATGRTSPPKNCSGLRALFVVSSAVWWATVDRRSPVRILQGLIAGGLALLNRGRNKSSAATDRKDPSALAGRSSVVSLTLPEPCSAALEGESYFAPTAVTPTPVTVTVSQMAPAPGPKHPAKFSTTIFPVCGPSRVGLKLMEAVVNTAQLPTGQHP
jgi:hypothetical protein